MQFQVEQHFAAPVDDVLAAYVDPDFYPTLTGLTKIGEPDVLGVERTGDKVRVRVRFRFTDQLPAAATTVIDPTRLTWVDESTYDLAARTSTMRLLPDHYADRLTASATATFTADPRDPQRTVRHIRGSLKVRMPLVGSKVERVIVNDLRAHLADEARLLGEFLTARG
jgi:hypothetical protein